MIATIMGFMFFALSLLATIMDIMAGDRPWHVIGEVWFKWAPTSLQVSESIISRYVDPCGIFVSLNCSPFLWHPVISTALQWYAAPVFLLLSFGLLIYGRRGHR